MQRLRVRELLEGCAGEVATAVREAMGDVPEVSAPMSAWAATVAFVIVGTDAQQTCAVHSARPRGRHCP